nr:hypothetical protein [Tanacetum cinerariifolium]
TPAKCADHHRNEQRGEDQNQENRAPRCAHTTEDVCLRNTNHHAQQGHQRTDPKGAKEDFIEVGVGDQVQVLRKGPGIAFDPDFVIEHVERQHQGQQQRQHQQADEQRQRGRRQQIAATGVAQHACSTHAGTSSAASTRSNSAGQSRPTAVPSLSGA